MVFDDKPESAGIGVWNDKHVYATLGDRDNPSPKWSAFPASWMQIPLDTTILAGNRVKMRNPVLVGEERVNGLWAEHWRGSNQNKAALDVWKSVDPRFPLVLAWTTKSPTSSLTWRITKLDITHAVPDYMFTPQVRPTGGLRAMLAQPFRPFGAVLILHIALLCCYIGFVYSFACKGQSRIVPRLLFGGGALLLLYQARLPSEYWHQLSDMWATLLLSLLTCGAIAMMWRVNGPPDDVRLFKGTRWPVLIYTLLAAGVGFLWTATYEQAFAHALEIDRWFIHFLPITLLSVLVYAAFSAALEEVVFRGYVFGFFEKRLWHPGKIILVQAFIFALFHVPKYLVMQGLGFRMFVSLVLIFWLGVIFGLLRWRYRNLAAPWVVHTAYNVAYFYVSSTFILGILRGLAF